MCVRHFNKWDWLSNYYNQQLVLKRTRGKTWALRQSFPRASPLSHIEMSFQWLVLRLVVIIPIVLKFISNAFCWTDFTLFQYEAFGDFLIILIPN